MITEARETTPARGPPPSIRRLGENALPVVSPLQIGGDLTDFLEYCCLETLHVHVTDQPILLNATVGGVTKLATDELLSQTNQQRHAA
ncbi:hypothetical protein Bca4012_042820 [Brassica carinata]|uniref:Uncharacterized protein n=3 Tax=Brassica TaxID=3705 RepID=A0A0D3E5Z1_BRAOL|nr:hypothetical protein HID58_086114 [Brassica napus]VDD30057.1 unnamed protein product [Brassica oleracea]KAH0857854.1 hypothetical protein HID58_086115 [Brassica napus]KAH0857855.1 hypothetical protein HID58_086116 [Brassica napus]CAF1729101.1 unnamed protein product [Brassica napus]